MSQIILIGANHKTAPVELREKLSFSNEETIAALDLLKQDKDIKESLIFSTCNRTEILYIPVKALSIYIKMMMQSDIFSRLHQAWIQWWLENLKF